MPPATVHTPKLLLGTYKERKIAIFTGRIHRYEGYKTYELSVIALYAALLGAQWLFATNAAGGCLVGMQHGSLMLIRDHLNNVGSCFIKSKLMSQTSVALAKDPRLCPDPHFDAKQCYSDENLDVMRQAAKDIGVKLFEGVYCMTNGPLYETHAEARLAERLGGGSLGMSTIPEILTAGALGLRTAGISMITNLASFLSKVELSDNDVREVAGVTQPILRKLLMAAILRAPLSEERKQMIQARFEPTQQLTCVLPLAVVRRLSRRSSHNMRC
jgi:purine-nucleoside phosphorylase